MLPRMPLRTPDRRFAAPISEYRSARLSAESRWVQRSFRHKRLSAHSGGPTRASLPAAAPPQIDPLAAPTDQPCPTPDVGILAFRQAPLAAASTTDCTGLLRPPDESCPTSDQRSHSRSIDRSAPDS